MKPREKWSKLGALATCGLALAAGWEFYNHSIRSLRKQETETLRDADDLRKRVEDAQQTIASIRTQEKDADRIRGELDRLQDILPAGSAMVSLPVLVKEHFARFGIAIPLIRLNTTQDEPRIPGYQRGFWSVALPIDDAGRNTTTMLLAVANLDTENSFIKVLDFAIRPDPENPDGRVGLLNLSAVIRN